MKQTIIKEIPPRRVKARTKLVEYHSITGEITSYYQIEDNFSELLKEDINSLINEIREDWNVETVKIVKYDRKPFDELGFLIGYKVEITMKEPIKA